MSILVVALWPAVVRAETPPNPDPSLIALWQPCEPGTEGPGTGITVVVDFNRLGDHKVYVRCAPPRTNGSGLDALKDSGFRFSGTDYYGPSFVCRIEGLPGTTGPDAQPCEKAAPADAYWSYWSASGGGSWDYSGLGAGSTSPRVGRVEGWSFSTSAGETIEPRIIPPGTTGPPFELPPVQPDVPDVSTRLRAATLKGLIDGPGTSPTGSTSTMSATADQITAWTAGGEPLGALAPYAAWLSDADQVARAVGGGKPLTAARYRAQPRDLTAVGLALISIGHDPTRLSSGQDLRAQLLSGVQPDGRIPITVQGNGAGTPDTYDTAYDPWLQARAIEFLALTGGAPKAVVDRFVSVAPFGGRYDDDNADPSKTARIIEALATARANGTPGLDGALERSTDALLALQQNDGSVTGDRVADTTAPAGLVSRALAVTGHRLKAGGSRDWVTQFQLTSAIAPADTDGIRPGVDLLIPSVPILRASTNEPLKSQYVRWSFATQGVASLPALSAHPEAVLRPVTPPVSDGPPNTSAPTTPDTLAPLVPAPIAPAPLAPAPPATRPTAPSTSTVRRQVRVVGRVPRVREVGRSGRLSVACTTATYSGCRVTATLTPAQARRIGLKARRGTLQIGVGVAAPHAAGTTRVSVRLTRTARRALSKATRPVRITLRSVDRDGTVSRTLTLRR